MIKIEQHHHKCLIKEYTSKDEIDFINKSLTFWNKNFLPINGQLYTAEKIIKSDELSFPAGYLNRLISKLKEKKIEVEVDDKRKFKKFPLYPSFTPKTELDELWETQVEAFNAIKKNYTGIIASATGSGKSRLIIEILKEIGGNTLIIVPSEDIKNKFMLSISEIYGSRFVSDFLPKKDFDVLVKYEKKEEVIVQKEPKEKTTADKLATLFSSNQEKKEDNKLQKNIASLYSKTNLFAAGENPEDKYLNKTMKYSDDKIQKKIEKEEEKKRKKMLKQIAPITVVCWQSLNNVSAYFLNQIDTLIIDECHRGSITQIRNSAVEMPNAQFRYFFSATPWRDLNNQLELLIATIGDNLIFDLGGKEAADKGIIARPSYVLVETPKPAKFLSPKALKNPRQRLVQGIIANVTRNAAIVEEAIKLYENNKNVFIAVDEISHMEILKERIIARGIKEVVCIHGQLNSKEKHENIKKVAETKGSLISIGTMAVGEGTDMPNISAVILASGGKSSIRMIQRIGRGTRKTKEEFIVVDFWDWFNEILLKHSKERIKTFNEEYNELRNLDYFKNKYSVDD
jgi:superfamily II DNA or RNA helicase